MNKHFVVTNIDQSKSYHFTIKEVLESDLKAGVILGFKQYDSERTAKAYVKKANDAMGY